MSDIKLKFTKLDGRHKGHKVFKYYVEAVSGSFYLGPSYYHAKLAQKINFNKLRNWCVDTWGYSCEFETYQELNSYNTLKINKINNLPVEVNPHWAWDVCENRSDSKNRIYIVSDKEKAWLDLKWM